MTHSADVEYDLFISYAAVDNDRPEPYDRWVAHFVQALRKALKAEMGGRDPLIYFDESTIEPNHRLEEILASCRRSKLFLAISSPAYHAREWTARELHTFVATNDDPRCLFLVELSESKQGDRLGPLTERHASRFYKADLETSVKIPLQHGERDFYIKMTDLAGSIIKQLTALAEMHPISAVLGAVNGSSSKTHIGPVLLAQASDDLEEDRDAVKRYLSQFNIEVLPAGDYPQGGAAFEEAFRQDLKRARLVVQLLSARAGRMPPDMPKGYARFQAEAAREAKVDLLQWRRSDVQPDKVTEAAHRELLTGPEVVASTLEQFKSEVLKRLEPKKEVEEKTEFLLFVNAEKADQAAGQRLRETLEGTCCVYMPKNDGSGSIQATFNEALGDCDALLLLYGNAEPEWVERQMLHLRKARAGKPRIPGAICYGPPPDKPEINLSMPGFREVICRSPEGTDWAVDEVAALLPEFRK
jgi:hypothetical protein